MNPLLTWITSTFGGGVTVSVLIILIIAVIIYALYQIGTTPTEHDRTAR